MAKIQSLRSRLKVHRQGFGETYLIPDAEGKEIPARLYDAVVLEREQAFGE